MSNHDQLYRYLFENLSVRGELVTVNHTLQQILANHQYPPAVKQLLGELLVTTSLLTATLKFTGEITVQLQGDGPLKLAVIHSNHQQEMRGIARLAGEIPDDSTLATMLGNGIMVITITPTQGERYQGIVALEGDTLTACLEAYFMQSEQLATRLFIRTGAYHDIAAGILLQILPTQDNHSDDLEHLAQLTATISAKELFSLSATEILYRLYHQEVVTLYPPLEVSFYCPCSRERSANALMAIPPEELTALLAQEGHIEIHCDYCGNRYLFNPEHIYQLINPRNPSDEEYLH